MIGGVDHVVAIATGVDLEWKRKTMRMISALWPLALVEPADGDHVLAVQDAAEGLHDEFFVYRDRSSYESWTEHGAVADESMIHFIIEDDRVTWVVGVRGGVEVEMISQSIRLGLLMRGGS